MRAIQRLLLIGVFVGPLPGLASLAQRTPANDAAEFEHRAQLSKELGATHMLVTEGLPLATWQMDSADPYPMWFAHHTGLLTIFPPPDVAPYVDRGYATEVATALQKRCSILAKYGLKGVWNANEPAVLPEAFFAAHPELRGPRIDQPNRSRKVYFAPSVDQPEVLRMYRDAMQSLLKTCPQVEQFNWVTTDAGSGFDWSPALYPGINGNTEFKDRPMSERVGGFLINAQQAAKAAGHDIQINLQPIEARQWMNPTFSPDVLRQTEHLLPPGLAVEGHEGPDGHAFSAVAVVRTNNGAFYPVTGLVVPSLKGGDLWPSFGKPPARMMINFGDSASIEENYRLFKFTKTLPLRTLSERTQALREFAASEVGNEHADDLMEVWSALNDVQTYLQTLNFGDMLRMGHVLNRWITRPMVPYPGELTDAEKKDYRAFLFQAKGEEQAGNLIDIQAMRMYEGWGAHLLFQHTIELSQARLRHTSQLVDELKAATKNPAEQNNWELMGERLKVLSCLLQSADDMVHYQAQLDRVKRLQADVESDPVLGVQSSWDRTDLMETARREIDTTIALQHILQTAKGPILDMAPSASGETIMRLGSDVATALQHKVATMNAHWRDYDRLFTKPNP